MIFSTIIKVIEIVIKGGGPYHTEQSIDLLLNSMDWLLDDKDLRHERVEVLFIAS